MINASLQDRLAMLIGTTIVAGCSIVALWGVSTTDALSSMLWDRPVLEQMLAVLGGSLLLVLLAWFAQARNWLAFPIIPILALAIWTIFLFGCMPVLAVAAFLVASVSAGSALAVMCRSDWDTCIRLIAGAAMLALLFTWISGVPVNTALSHAAILSGVTLLSLAMRSIRSVLWKDARHLLARFRLGHQSNAFTLAETFATAWLVGIFAWLLSLSALPEVYHDALVVHLYVPSYMSANLKWGYDPELYAFAVMPMAVTHLYAHLFLLGGETAARLLNVVALALVCVTTYRIIVASIDRVYGLVAVGLYVSTPIAYIESATLFIENVLSLWIIGAAYTLLRYRDRLQNAAPAILLMLAAGCASKLHGVIIAAILGVVLIAMIYRQAGFTAVLRTFPLAVLSACVGAYPYISAFWVTGNPLFPFFNDIFKSPYFAFVSFKDDRWIHPVGWGALYDATFFSGDYMEAVTGALGLTWLVFLPAAIWVALWRPRSPAMLCLAVGLGATAVVWSQIQYLRYIFPFLPLMTVAIALLLQMIDRSWFRYLFPVLIIAIASFNAFKIPSAGWVLGSSDLRANLDEAFRRQYETALAPERIANRMINNWAGTDARVLYTGPPFGGLLEGTALYANWYSERFRRDGASVTTAEIAARYMADLHVQYVVHRSDTQSPFTNAVLAALATGGREVAKIGQLSVYEIKP